MAAGSLARRYAKAIVQIGEQDGSLARIGADLTTLGTAMRTSAELGALLASPAIRKADRKRVIDALTTRIGAHPTTKTVTALLLDRERLSALPDIAREVAAMIEAKANRVSADVTSATALTPAQLAEIVAALEKLSGKKVDAHTRQDPALLGGVVAKVGDVIYDGSVRSQLRALRDELSR